MERPDRITSVRGKIIKTKDGQEFTPATKVDEIILRLWLTTIRKAKKKKFKIIGGELRDEPVDHIDSYISSAKGRMYLGLRFRKHGRFSAVLHGNFHKRTGSNGYLPATAFDLSSTGNGDVSSPSRFEKFVRAVIECTLG